MTQVLDSGTKTTSWTSPLTRRKTNASGEGGESDEKLARVLGLLDLTSLGVGSTLGLGVYVLAGKVALYDAGPAVTISFLIAAIASAFAGLCYAELASRVPKAGSAYVYCYVTIGEFAAFVIGWNLILEYAIGTAAMAKALSDYVDFSTNGIISHTLIDLFPMKISFLAPYPDFFACGLVLILTALLAWGVKESSRVNNVFTLVNVLTVLVVIVAGVFKANANYWSIPKEAIPAGVKGGEGGFLPFGWSGVFTGAATCFFGYVGFDVIATTGDEAKNPKRNIPLALVISLIIIFMAYFGVATVITMLVPYYSQDEKAPLTKAFSEVGLPVVMWIISIGAMCALCASLLGAIFPLPRILYAMADDGLLFSSFSDVNKYTKTPLKATLISGILTGIFAAVFDLKQLMDMMSIGTLLAYSIVALCILILRYSVEEKDLIKPLSSAAHDASPKLTPPVKNIWDTFKISFNLNGIKFSTMCSEKMALWSLLYFVIFITLLCFTSVYGGKFFGDGVLFYALMVAFSILCVISFIIISRQPQGNTSVSFKVPLVPLVPICSISMNIYLMMVLDINTWIRFIIWLAMGFLIYFYYSLDHSVEGKKRYNENAQNTTSIKVSPS